MSEYYAVIRSTDHLAHYGVKGMKWGVRKAIIYGDQKKLDRHFRKAAKKLAKLQDIGLNSKKYAAKAAAYGAAAAGTGTLAIKGGAKVRSYLKKSIAGHLARENKAIGRITEINETYNHLKDKKAVDAERRVLRNEYHSNKRMREIGESINKWIDEPSGLMKGKMTKGQVIKAGTGLAAIGLGAKAAQNAYRAANGTKYRAKASQFKTAMDEAFAGTKYAGKYVAEPKQRKRKRR